MRNVMRTRGIRRGVGVVTVMGTAMVLGAAVALAAASGSFSLAVTGASASGTYKYNVRPAGTYTGTGIYYSGTLRNTGTTDSHSAYFYAQVEGYGYRQLAKAAARTNASIGSVVYDPAALYVRHSRGQVCRDRTLLGQNCQVGTYNY